MRNFINRVQNSDETTKRFWVILCSGTSMLLVIALWLFYINMTIARVDAPEQKQLANTVASTGAAANDIKAPGFIEVFASGAKIIFTEIRERLSVKNEFTIENPEVDFIADGLPEINPTKLSQ